MRVPGASASRGRVTIGRALVPTGIAIELPGGYVGRIGARSGLSTKHNVEIGAGWIDPDYRGELQVEVKNFGPVDFLVKKNMRIAQLFVLRTAGAKLRVVKRLSRTARGGRGFGSTG